ncbi:MAG TPA: hypothetical protein VFT87_03480, partial [Candidatus Saccharimonadales bacterium]|nr:hypothetical protein [Candidatus Saccharimonadales bacterium]
MTHHSIGRNNSIVHTILLWGTYLVGAAIALLLVLRSNTDSHLIVWGILFLSFSVIAAHLLRGSGRQRAASYLLVVFYLLLASGIAWRWGVHVPIGQLVFALAIVLAGILLTTFHALLVAIISSVQLMLICMAAHMYGYQPLTWADGQPSLGDVFIDIA